jgi:DNA-binding CsgD family transcriptional regulator
MGLSSLLTHPDIVHWHEDIAYLFDCSTDEHLPPRLSEVVNKVIRHEAFILKLYKSGSNLPVILSHDIPAHLHELYFNRYLSFAYLEDPLLARVQNNRASQIVQINPEICPLKGTDYYRTYYKDLSLQDEIDFWLPMTNGDALVLSLGRKAAIATQEEISTLQNTSALVKSVLGNYYRSLPDSTDARQRAHSTMPSNIEKLLTAREKEIVYLMVSGKGTKELARHLDISIQTVKVHRRNIYSKLSISTELQLCSLYLSTQPHLNDKRTSVSPPMHSHPSSTVLC